MKMLDNHWLILRTSDRHTLGLADALNDNGLNAWTPERHVRIRKASWPTPREIREPLMPSYVFTRASHANDLVAHDLDLPPFGFFHPFGPNEYVPDHQLDPLRDAEKNGFVIAKEHYWRKGDKVYVTGGIFGGMNGIIERGHAENPTVRFGSRMRVKISSLLLSNFEVDNSKIAPNARTGSSLFGR